MKRIVLELTDAEWLKLEKLARKRSKSSKRVYTMLDCIRDFIRHSNTDPPIYYGSEAPKA